MRHRRCLLAVIVALCAATANAQYVEDSIDVGGAWVGSLVYNSAQDEVWGSSWGANSVFAISCDSNKVVAALALRRAGDLAYDSLNGKLYCAYYGPGQESLAVIGGVTHQITKKLEMPGSTMPVWDAVSDRLYVSCQSTNSVAVVDCATDSVLKYVPVGACPMKMYINTLRRKLYVLNYDDGTISIVDLMTDQIIRSVAVGDAPNAGYYCRGVDKFYSGGSFRQCVVIGGQSDTIVARVPLTGNVEVIGATGNEDAGLIYLGGFVGSGDYVATVSAQGDSVVATTVIGREPWGLAYNGESGLLYCASALTDQVFVLAGDGAVVLTTLQVGDYPFVFAQVPQRDRLYLGHSGGTHVYVLRDTSEGIGESHPPRAGFSEVLNVTPNPFGQNAAVIRNSPASGGEVTRVYAQDGRMVRQAQISAGQSRWVWDGRDDSGALLPPGVYVVEAGPGLRAKVVKFK